jgi:serine/arginine repetitive matrix protein 2
MAWQLQAQKSFGNKQARTLVKARSKSLANGQRRGHQTQSSLDYLAAQACLGNQNLHPSLSTTDVHSTSTSSSRKISHSKNTSLAPTLSKSSKSHSKNHSRGDSWSKPAVKMAISTAAICGFSSTEDEITVLDVGDARAASLEGAIKRDGTRVIRLADPVHLPVDRGPPISSSPDSSVRLSSSPSNGSDQRVGIALGTPPQSPLGDEQSDSSFHPSHPYAQGGLSFSVPGPSSQTRLDRGVDFAGPHPSINSGVDISQIPDSLARHKLPPHLYLHPYGQRLSRDSYLDQNGLLAQYRSGNETPHQNKMWAQLSPGVLREVLPNDIQYSPFTPPQENNMSSPVMSVSSRDSIMQINDTIGVGEILVNAERVRRSQVSRPDTDADVMLPISQVDGDKQSQNSLSDLEPRIIRQPIEHNSALSEDSDASLKPSFTNQIVSSPLQRHSPTPLLLSDRAVTTSPTVTSTTSSSPPLTPCRLGSPNDLESFQDLFYRPSNDLQRTPIEAALPDTPSPPHFSATSWDRSMQRHKAESGLTSLARQLSQEFELMTRVRERSSQHSSSMQSPTRQQQRGTTSSTISRQPTVRSLEFVFEEASSPSQSERPVPELDDRHAIHAFQPSDSLPEDVESSRASSVIEIADAEDETGM